MKFDQHVIIQLEFLFDLLSHNDLESSIARMAMPVNQIMNYDKRKHHVIRYLDDVNKYH